MTTYTLDDPVRKKLVDYYYDNDAKLLEENVLLLRKRVFGQTAELKIKRRYFDPQYFYTDNLRSHEREKEIPAKDHLEAQIKYKHIVFRDKTKYTRKKKHKNKTDE